MAVLSHVIDHRLERLRVAVVVVFVNELDGTEAAQVVKRLLECQPEATPEFGDKNERPFHLVCKAVCHIYVFYVEH